MLLIDEGKGPIKSISPISNSSTSKIVCKGGSSRFDMLPIIWHLSQVDTNWWASLNKVGWAKRIPTEVPLQLFYFPQSAPHMLECGSDLGYSPFLLWDTSYYHLIDTGLIRNELLPVVMLQLYEKSLLLLITKLWWEHSCHQVVHKISKPRYWLFVFNFQKSFVGKIIIDMNFFTQPFQS